MLKEKNYLFSRLNQALDLLVVALAFELALVTRNAVLVPNLFPTAPLIHIAEQHWTLWLFAGAVILFQSLMGVYNSQRLRLARDLVGSVALACLLAAGATIAAAAAARLSLVSKPQILYLGLWALALLTLKMALVKRFFLPCGRAASMSATCSWSAVGLIWSASSTSSRLTPSGASS